MTYKSLCSAPSQKSSQSLLRLRSTMSPLVEPRESLSVSSQLILSPSGDSNGVLFALCALSKAGMSILRLAATQQQESKARESGSCCRKSLLDQMAALLLRRHARLQPLMKPRNCRRIVVLGAPRVGKTSILRRFLRDGFEERYEPTAEDFHRKLYHIRGETYQIDILDASGERSFPAKRRLSILTGDIFLLVFSVNDRSSFEEVNALQSEIVSAKSTLHGSKKNLRIPLISCANKVDLPSGQRAVSRAEILHSLGSDCVIYETSAKDGVNLEQVFASLARLGGLPLEIGPSRHRMVSIHSYQTLRMDRATVCGALHPLARRPSFGSDLRLILGPKKQCKTEDRCQILRTQTEKNLF